MASSFLDQLRQRGVDPALARAGCGGPAGPGGDPAGGRAGWGGRAARGVKRAGGAGEQRAGDSASATGVDSSTPVVADPNGNRLRRDLLEECGHLRRWRDDLQLVKELGTPVLR